MSFKYSFDSKCYELAEHFLHSDATESVKKELAQAVQDAVENFFGGYGPDFPGGKPASGGGCQ